jgi:primosomal protein N'
MEKKLEHPLWTELSNDFYEIAHKYKEGEFDYRFIWIWFQDQADKYIIEKISDKKMELPKIEEIQKIKEKLTSELLNVFGWNAEYYLTELTETSLGWTTSKITEKVNIKVLIPDSDNDHGIKDVPYIEIPIKKFVENKEPQPGDLVFFPDLLKFYHVISSSKISDLFRVELTKYDIMQS